MKLVGYDKDANGNDQGDYKGLPAGCLEFYAASVALGLDAVHKAGYVYRNLKPINVLLDAQGQVRLSDMGLARDISGGPTSQQSGTRGYWPPEIIDRTPYTTEPDWWSLGVIMFVMFTHKMPFHATMDELGDEDAAIDAATCAGVIDYKHGEPEDLQSIISALCTIDMTKRLGVAGGVDDLKSHPYFTKKSFDWARLERGAMEAPWKPNVNDTITPSAMDIAAIPIPSGVVWDDVDRAEFADWGYFNEVAWEDEAIARIRKKRELEGAGGEAVSTCTIC